MLRLAKPRKFQAEIRAVGFRVVAYKVRETSSKS